MPQQPSEASRPDFGPAAGKNDYFHRGEGRKHLHEKEI